MGIHVRWYWFPSCRREGAERNLPTKICPFRRHWLVHLWIDRCNHVSMCNMIISIIIQFQNTHICLICLWELSIWKQNTWTNWLEYFRHNFEMHSLGKILTWIENVSTMETVYYACSCDMVSLEGFSYGNKQYCIALKVKYSVPYFGAAYINIIGLGNYGILLCSITHFTERLWACN